MLVKQVAARQRLAAAYNTIGYLNCNLAMTKRM
jgi:hypothetical protein